MRRSVLALVMVLLALPSAVSQSCLGGIVSVNPGNVGDQITTLTEIPFSDLNGITSGGLPLDLTIFFDDMKFLESSGDVIYRVEITYSGGIDLSSPVAQPSYDEWYLLDKKAHEIPLTQPGLSKAASLGSIGWQKLGMVVDTDYIPGVGSQPFYGLHYLWETPQASPTVTITGARLVIEPRHGGMATIRQIPEPSTLVIWSLLGALGIAVCSWRRRRSNRRRCSPQVAYTSPAAFQRK